ncbi:hypothetical protein Mpal_0910 [Methanosphaerula palustris E1-9c]|uniref:Uncharacterized protein n=1 Tax=Methanosphaerula palustris (strain ATCC BAA-1556 / DSM 19958 / E1-9c) TaxID=521011 RepID=B8GGK9_METPE|nr:hypothetical protein Mpal_0910 [Methanosphaerula palustris E1-9c]
MYKSCVAKPDPFHVQYFYKSTLLRTQDEICVNIQNLEKETEGLLNQIVL